MEMIESGEVHVPSEGSPLSIPLKLSLVIPAYNEELRLPAGLDRLKDAITMGAITPESTQFIVVDDGSTDNTAASARALLAEFPHVHIIRLEKNAGKGAAVRAGVAASTAPIIAFADADMAIDPQQTPQFIEALTSADLAIGSRAATGASVDRNSIGRSIMNRSFNRLVNAVTKVSLDDTQCGFKAFRAPAAKLLFHCTHTQRMAFDVELLSLARRMGFSIAQVPVHWLRVRGSRVRSVADSPSMVRDVFRARRGWDAVPPLLGIVVTLPVPAGIPLAQPHAGLAYLRELSGLLPVLHRDAGTYLALCPLMREVDVAHLVHDMTRHLDAGDLERTDVTMADLRAMAPLALTWDDASIGSEDTPSAALAGDPRKPLAQG